MKKTTPRLSLNPRELLEQLCVRWRYPLSLPEEIAWDLGVGLSNTDTFEEVVSTLSSSSCCAEKLHKFMAREEAEKNFGSASQCERFCDSTLFGYYFSEGWIEFALKFDEKDRLRRVYFKTSPT